MVKKILFVETAVKKYGGQKALLNILTDLDRARFEPVVACPKGSQMIGSVSDLGIEFLETDSISKTSEKRRTAIGEVVDAVKTAACLVSFVRREKVGLVHANTYKAALLSVLASKLNNVPLIWHDRDFTKHGLWDIFLALSCDRIIEVSEAARENRRSRFSRGKIRVIYDGVRQCESGSLPGMCIMDDFGFGPDDILVGTVSRISPGKGLEYLIRAASLVVRKTPRAKFLIVGGVFRPEDHEYFSGLQRMRNEMGLEKNIVFSGQIDDPMRMTSAFDISVVPSLSESFGMAVVESMALGIPVIASGVGGIKEIVEDGVSGMLVDPGDPEKIAEKVIELINDGQKRKKLGDAARKRSRDLFSMERFIKDMEGLYGELII